jgi:alpha-glucuronidase
MMSRLYIRILGALLFSGWGIELLHAGSDRDAWLRYAPLEGAYHAGSESLPASLVVLGDSDLLRTAGAEMIRGIEGMTGKTLRTAKRVEQRAIVLGTLASIHAAVPELARPGSLSGDGFWLVTTPVNDFDSVVVISTTDRGVLYGVFAFLGKVARGESIFPLNQVQQPYASIRWVDQWDNLNGTIERGYAGPSIFFEKGSVRADLSRAGEYARLLASIGINGCTINNVNADPRIIDDSFLPQLVRIADVFRPWGLQVAVSADLGSPRTLGNLDSFDPLNPQVVEWWRTQVDKIYRQIPDFGGFVVKADSEGRSGPSSYGRTPADAANVIARALKPHGGILFYRAFVYDHHLDWRNPKNDRARAAYDIFHPLDGKFDDNVVIQIKYGPIDFQAREPVSPLLGGLGKTNQGIELQVTQEYTGQQRHLCFLPVMWKEILDLDLRVNGDRTPVKDLVAGKVFQRPAGAFVGVANVGMGIDSDQNWLGHPLAMANLYGFGRLAWDPNLSAESIAEEWTRLTFGNDPVVVKTIGAMLLASWHAYENYTGPLGAQTLTDILGSHYGPGIESSEQNGWGQWHRADHEGIGMDRTLATGTGYVGQYPPAIRELYESVQTTPDELLLFFHHIPYTYRLQSGKTVIQHIYDSHYEGAEQAADFVRQWKLLEHRVPDGLYKNVLPGSSTRPDM